MVRPTLIVPLHGKLTCSLPNVYACGGQSVKCCLVKDGTVIMKIRRFDSSVQGCGVDEFPGDSDSDSDSDPPESTPTPTPTPESTPALYGLTLTGKVIFAIFHDTRGEGLVQTPCRSASD